MIGPILRRARKGNSRRIIMEARLPHFLHNPRPAPFSAPPRNTNQKPARFSSVRVGRNSIRPTDGHAGGRTDRKIAIFSGTRVGRNSIRPTNGHASGRTDRKIAIFQVARVGAYCIRPTSGHGRGRMNLIPIRFLILRIKTNQKFDGFSIPRPKTNLNSAGFSNPGSKGMAIPDA